MEQSSFQDEQTVRHEHRRRSLELMRKNMEESANEKK